MTARNPKQHQWKGARCARCGVRRRRSGRHNWQYSINGHTWAHLSPLCGSGDLVEIARGRFEAACALLRECVEAGFEIYVAGSIHLMSGPSHDENGAPRRDRILESESVPGMSGGDW